MNPSSNEIRGATLITMMAACLWIENRRPLRTPTQPKARRVLVNISIAAAAALALKIAFYPIVLKISVVTETKGWGLIPRLGLPASLSTLLTLLVLDYTLYIWHRMMHKIPSLWRFHNVHHMDLDLDTSTALRFHFGELIISTLYRSMQIGLFGVNAFNLILFETCITTFAQFHHSNIRLPFRFERHLSRFIVSPRMHGIHHSIIDQETNSNFGSILTLWDRLHQTLRLNVYQKAIAIGVPSYRDPHEQTFTKLILAPFRRQRAWKLPNGVVPERQNLAHNLLRELAL